MARRTHPFLAFALRDPAPPRESYLHVPQKCTCDGAQTQGVDFSVEDKRTIASALDALGIDYVEGGWPGANPTDTAFFGEPPKLKKAKLTAFGMTKKSGRSAGNDPGLASLFG